MKLKKNRAYRVRLPNPCDCECHGEGADVLHVEACCRPPVGVLRYVGRHVDYGDLFVDDDDKPHHIAAADVLGAG